MSDERTLGEWHVHMSPGKAEPVVLDAENRPVATVHGASDEEVFRRSLLIAAAPTLRDTVASCVSVFDTIARASTDPIAQAIAKEDMLPMLVSVLTAAGVEVTTVERGSHE